MAHLLDANPDLRRHVEFWGKTGQMIPLVHDGEFQGFINRSRIRLCPAPTPLPVADFILGMEAMGHRFDIAREHEDGPEKLILSREIGSEPESWQLRANELLRAFGHGRRSEGIAFLRKRDGTTEAAK